jgi:hypothetical protein
MILTLSYFVTVKVLFYLTKDQMFYERTKHIDIKYHYVHDVVA